MALGQRAASDWLYATCCSTHARARLTITVVWCFMAVSCGFLWWGFHFLLLLRHPPWRYLFLASLPPAFISTGVVWVFITAWKARHEAIEQRQADLHQNLLNIIHLNDRVRNALQAIAYASHARSQRELFHVLHESVESIEQELRAITPKELQIADWVPKKPVTSTGTSAAPAVVYPKRDTHTNNC